MSLHELVKKARAVKVLSSAGDEYVDGVLSKSHPFIHAFLTSTQGEKKGEIRLTSTLTLCVDDGTPKAILNDREEQASLFASGESFAAAQDALERKLAEGTKEWRAWQGKARKKR